MGNVTLEELHEAMKGMVLFDGIPATYFLSLVSKKELVDFTNKILCLFSPKIILGISDMLPPNGDIGKVRSVSEIVEKYVPYRLPHDEHFVLIVLFTTVKGPSCAQNEQTLFTSRSWALTSLRPSR